MRWDHGNDQTQEDQWEERLYARIVDHRSEYVAPGGQVNAQSMILAEQDEILADMDLALQEQAARDRQPQWWTLPGGTVCCPRHIDGCPPGEQPPVLDGNGNPVPGGVPAGIPSDTYRLFMAGRVPAPACPHYAYASEVAAGMTTCERCG